MKPGDVVWVEALVTDIPNRVLAQTGQNTTVLISGSNAIPAEQVEKWRKFYEDNSNQRPS
jgi:hypothetical protein